MCWHCQGDHYKKDCPTALKPGSPQRTNQPEKNNVILIKTYCKKLQDRRQINKLCTPVNDSGEEFNIFISEFENITLEDLDYSSA